MAKEKENRILGEIYEWLLCAYIVLAPINNALNHYGIYATVVLTAMAVFGLCLVCKLVGHHPPNLMDYCALVVAMVLGIQCVIQRFERVSITSQWVYTVLLYTIFLTLPSKMNMKRIYCAVYVASLLGAMFSIVLGIAEGSVTRTATSVDGSLAVIGIVTVLFAQEDFEKTEKYKLLKILAFFACLIVAGFGMSRARIVLILCLLVVKVLFSGGSVLISGRVSATVLLSIPFLIVLFFVIIRLETVGNVLASIENRFVDGFQSLLRDKEISVGWQGFESAWFLGRGWGELGYRYNFTFRTYFNHCMYVAILARGGITLGIPLLISFLWLIRDALRSKNLLVIVMLTMFFLLGYGNAGIFNYTINSMFIVLIPLLKQSLERVEQERLRQQQIMAGELMQNTVDGKEEEVI